MLNRIWFLLVFFAVCLPSPADLFAQEYDYQYELGKFGGADAFSVNSTGNIYIADKETNEIYKYDTLGHELKSIGGYGWDEGSFDQPGGIFATVLYVYVADRNNHRVQVFDKDLNFLLQIKGDGSSSAQQSSNDEVKFGYPAACVTSSLGDIFILDMENKQILKMNSSGQLVSRFGNYQSGDYELNSPKAMAVSPDNKLVVLDNSKLIIFDQYGNGVGKIALDFNAENVNIAGGKMVLSTSDKIFSSDLNERGSGINELQLQGYDLNSNIAGGLIFKDKLYVLTAHQVIAYKKKKAE